MSNDDSETGSEILVKITLSGGHLTVLWAVRCLLMFTDVY